MVLTVNDILDAIESRWPGTFAELAKAADIAQSTLHAWRKGTTEPKFVDLQRLAKVVRIDLQMVRRRQPKGTSAQLAG
jgi:transcriptional regulator with XRE-family HTH domain